jgi:hypothetical protein
MPNPSLKLTRYGRLCKPAYAGSLARTLGLAINHVADRWPSVATPSCDHGHRSSAPLLGKHRARGTSSVCRRSSRTRGSASSHVSGRKRTLVLVHRQDDRRTPRALRIWKLGERRTRPEKGKASRQIRLRGSTIFDIWSLGFVGEPAIVNYREKRPISMGKGPTLSARARPNPSLKRGANGTSPGPGR